MPLQRLTRVVRRFPLGPLRLWLDDLAEITRLVRELPNAVVRIEADQHTLTDVVQDLRELGQRLSYFTVTASSQPEDEPPTELMRVSLSRSFAVITATEPSRETLGLIEEIRILTAGRRRLPTWLTPVFVNDPDGSYNSNVIGIAAFAVSLTGEIIAIAGTVHHYTHGPWHPFGWPGSLLIAIAGFLALALLTLGFSATPTELITATRKEAPTFWQRHGADIAINVIVAAVFFLLGLLTAHL